MLSALKKCTKCCRISGTGTTGVVEWWWGGLHMWVTLSSGLGEWVVREGAGRGWSVYCTSGLWWAVGLSCSIMSTWGCGEDRTITFAICASALESMTSLLIYSEDIFKDPGTPFINISWIFGVLKRMKTNLICGKLRGFIWLKPKSPKGNKPYEPSLGYSTTRLGHGGGETGRYQER